MASTRSSEEAADAEARAAPVRRMPADGLPAAEASSRHYVTLLFSDLSRSTEIARAMEAEPYAALLATLREAYQDIIPRWGGTIVRVQGDGLLAMFGHPKTSELAGRQAVEAALALHRSVLRRTDIELQLHSGIHAGLVLIGSGDIERGRFELTGSVPNIAARLADAALPREIIVSDETLGPARQFYAAGAPTWLSVKGVDAPLLVHRLDAGAEARGGSGQRGPPQVPLVGREAESARLEIALEQVRPGRSGAVEIAGLAGIGKTRLVHEFLQQARRGDCAVLVGNCEGHGGSVALQPFLQMLPALARDAAPATAADWAACFAHLAAERPLVLCVEDWQWADDASHQVLAATRQAVPERLLVVVTRRLDRLPGEATPGMETIFLQPLEDAAARQSVAAQLPGADPFVVDDICASAGGNPLFIEELCHSVAREQSGRLAPPADPAGWMKQLVESRVQHLEPALAAMVRTASVIGYSVPTWLLASVSGCAEDSPAVRALAEHDFLFPGQPPHILRFKHGVTRDAIYASVGYLPRKLLHLRIGATLMQHAMSGGGAEDAEALAMHFGAGGDPALEAHYAERAGDRALAVSALDRARKHYRAALAALQRGELVGDRALRWADIAQRLAMVCMFDPERDQIRLTAQALRLAEQHGDLRRVARARHWLGCVHYALGEPKVAIVHGEQALREARQAGDEPLAVQVVASLGEAHAAAGQYAPAAELLDRAIAVKRSHRSGRRTNVGLAYTLVCRGVVEGDRGRFADASRSVDEALECLVGLSHQIGASIQGWRGAVLLWQGHWADARRAAADSARIAEATRSLWQLSIARAIESYATWMLDGTPEAMADIVDVTEWLLPRDSGLFRSLTHGWLAEGLVSLGRTAEARRHAGLAVQRARRGDRIGLAMACRAMARAAQRAGQADAARRQLACAHRVAQRRDSAHERAVTTLAEAELAAADGEHAVALRLAGDAARAFEAMAMTWHLAQAEGLRGRLGSRSG